MTTTTREVFKFEVALSVDNYLDDDDPDVPFAFEDCQSDSDGARQQAWDEMAEYLSPDQLAGVKMHSVSFVEFDSSNWTHAAGYFEVECEADPSIVEALTGDDKLLPYDEPDDDDYADRAEWRARLS